VTFNFLDFCWASYGKRAIMVNVISQNLDLVKERIERLFESAEIDGINLEIIEREGKIVVSGEIPEDKSNDYDNIIAKFSDEIIDIVKDEEIEDLVQVDLQVTELSTTLSKALGIDWTTSGNESIIFPYPEDPWPTDGHIRDFFKIGEFNRTGTLLATVNALLAEGKARILSQPRLVVVSGQEASFLVGGEIPIRTTTSTGTGATQENIEFKEFGISMSVTPTIKKNKIDIQLNVEVSDVDASNAVGDDVAFTTRTAQTQLLLDNGQTIVLAGLIKQNRSESINKIPFLGDIPIVGLLFRNRTMPTADLDQELVISLTSRILPQSEPEKKAQKKETEEKEKMASKDKPIIMVKLRTDSKIDTKTDEKVTPEEATEQTVVRPMIVVPHYLGIPKEMNEYIQSLQQEIAKAIIYPHEARQQGWEGTVKVGLLILNDGTLAFALIKESSGHEIFDKYALNTAKSIAPYSSFPSNTDLQELNVTIPIVYRLRNN